jgi:hypothetical protein
MKKTINTYNGTIRINLPKPCWKGWEEIGTGIFLTAVFYGRESKRLVVETDSIWENRNTHCCEGTAYRLIEDTDEKNTYLDYVPEEYHETISPSVAL